MLDADMFVLLTGEDKVCLHYNTAEEKPLDSMTVAQARSYMEEGEFEEGTILPKIQAAIDFIGDSAVKTVLITRLDKSKEAMAGKTGTVIYK